MKRKLFTLLTLLCLAVTGAWASTVDDLVTISENYTFIASSIGETITNGTLYDEGRILSVGGSGYGNNGFQVKNNRQIAFKVSGACIVTITFKTNSTRAMQLGTTTTGSQYGSSTTSPHEYTVTAGGVLYINATSDLYMQSFTVTFPSNDKPFIETHPISATYESGDAPAALTVAATASAGDLSYQWYSNTDGDTTGKDADKIAGATAATLPGASISTATAGTYYYYCIVTDSNGSTASSKATITVVNLINPTISYASTTNTVTITYGGTGTVYYTTDNSEPTSSSIAYTEPFVLTNTSTVRAAAIKGENKSEIVFSNCYVNHKAAALAVIGFGDGTHASGTWTSSDGNYILKSSNGSDIQYYKIFSGSDGFKLNSTNTYTLKVSDNIKVTSIKFVGISRSDAVNNSTIAFDGFTPESGTIEMGTFVKTIEFTPTSPLAYGATINITTGGNQFGGYFEIYGEEYTTNTSILADPVTWDFTNWSDATKAGVKADATNWDNKEKDSGLDWSESDAGRANKVAIDGALKYSSTNIAETDGLSYKGTDHSMALIFDLPSTTLGTYHGSQFLWLYGSSSIITIPSVTKGSIIEIGVESHKDSEARSVTLSNATLTQGATSGDAAKAYQVCKWEVTTAGDITITPSKGLHIYYIKLEKATDAVAFTPAYAKTTYVTPKALDFSNVDGLKAYVATAAAEGSVTLSEVRAVPAGTPLMLIGTAETEYTVPVAAEAEAPATNMFVAGDGTTEFDGSTFDFILWSDGKFYQIGSGTVATNKAYLHCTSDPRTAANGARSLDIVFEEGGATSINEELRVKNEESSAPYYNLNGQRVVNPTKGLYIVNGKKVAIK